MLLRAGRQSEAANRFGASPLSEGGARGNAEIVKALLEPAPTRRTLDADGETVLMTAARAGNVDAVRMLLDRGADVNARRRYKGQTALMWAAPNGIPRWSSCCSSAAPTGRSRRFDRETEPPKAQRGLVDLADSRAAASRALLSPPARATSKPRARCSTAASTSTTATSTTPRALVVAIMNKQFTLAKFLIDRGADPTSSMRAAGRRSTPASTSATRTGRRCPNRTTDDPLPSLEIVKALLARGAKRRRAAQAPLPGRSGMDRGDTSLGDGTTPLMRAARTATRR
jgi:hypothetical protein